MSMHRRAIKQQDNLDLDVALYVAETKRQTIPREKGNHYTDPWNQVRSKSTRSENAVSYSVMQ